MVIVFRRSSSVNDSSAPRKQAHPFSHRSNSCSFGVLDHPKFFIPFAPGFFAVFSEEIGPAAQHIAMQVLDDNGDAVGGSIGLVKKVLFFQLFKGPFPNDL